MFYIALYRFMGKRKRYFCGKKRAVFKFLKRGAHQKGQASGLTFIIFTAVVLSCISQDTTRPAILPQSLSRR